MRAVTGEPLLDPILHACGWATALLVIALVVWRRRLRLTVTVPVAAVPS